MRCINLSNLFLE